MARMYKNRRQLGQGVGGGEVVAVEAGVEVVCEEGGQVGVQEEGGR